jgi:hypothetical protein
MDYALWKLLITHNVKEWWAKLCDKKSFRVLYVNGDTSDLMTYDDAVSHQECKPNSSVIFVS